MTTESTRKWLFAGNSEDPARHSGSWQQLERRPQGLSLQRDRHQPSTLAGATSRRRAFLKGPVTPIGIGGVCEGFVFRSGCGELKIDFVIPWVRVTLEALQSPLAPLSPLSGSVAAVEVGGGWAAGFHRGTEVLCAGTQRGAPSFLLGKDTAPRC